MITIFQGVESPDHRATLQSVRELFEDDIAIVGSISYRSLRSRRLGAAYIRDTAGMFPVVIEAGAINAQLSHVEAKALEDEYYRFTAEVEELVYVVQFDHTSMGTRSIPEGDNRIIPVLTDTTDLGSLDTLLNAYGSVAMARADDSRIPTLLRKHQRDDSLYLALSQPDLEKAKRSGFNAVMTQAWLAPGKFGEISIWDGSKFHRHNNADRDQVLHRHSGVIERAGLDMDLLMNGDSRELVRLSAYSFISWAISIDGVSDNEPASTSTEREVAKIVSTSMATKPVTQKRAQVPIPGFESTEITGLEEHPDGSSTITTRRTLRLADETVRVCNTCFLANTCPAYERDSSCAFNFPVEVRTDAQVKSLLHSMIELQASRVAFARFAEETNGGYPDPVVGQEMDRLVRMSDRIQKFGERRERLTVSVESEASGSGTGVLSRIFGERAAVPPMNPEMIVAEVIDGTNQITSPSRREDG